MTASAAIIGSQAISAIGGGIAGLQAGNAEAAALNENARLEELNGNEDALARFRQSRIEEGAALAGAAAGGTSVGSGSIADLVYANAAAREHERLTVVHQAKLRASGIRQQASQAKSEGRSALFRGVFRAGAAALTGISKNAAANKLDAATSRKQNSNLRRKQPLGAIPLPNNFNGPR